MSKYNTIQQHEPLRASVKWGTEERRFIAQLEEIFDDLYRRFNRLRLEDLGEELRETIIQSEQSISTLQQTADQIIAGVTPVGRVVTHVDPSDPESGSVVIVDQNGVEIKSGGSVIIRTGGDFQVQSGSHVYVDSDEDDSYIRFGGTAENPNFIVGKGGNVVAQSGIFSKMSIDGSEAVRAHPGAESSLIFVGQTPPAGLTNYLWFKPINSGPVVQTDYYGTPAEGSGTAMGGTSPRRQVTLTRSGSALTADEVSYGIRVRIYNYGGREVYNNVRITLRQSANDDEITIYNQAMGVAYAGDYVTVDTLQTPEGGKRNITASNGIIVTIYATKQNGVAARLENAQIVLRCSAATSSGTEQCEVRWVK